MNAPVKTSTRGKEDLERYLAGKRACILDDESNPITILEAYLSKYGVHTKSFNHPGPALEYLKTDPPDILLLDIMMPEIDGWQFYTILRTDPQLCSLPVLFVSCLVGRDLEKDMEQDGLCASLSKPVYRDQLVEKMVQLLEGLEGQRTARHKDIGGTPPIGLTDQCYDLPADQGIIGRAAGSTPRRTVPAARAPKRKRSPTVD